MSESNPLICGSLSLSPFLSLLSLELWVYTLSDADLQADKHITPSENFVSHNPQWDCWAS